MHKVNSIVYRLTGLTFLLLFSTIGILLYLVNDQMNQHFEVYLNHTTMMDHVMGSPEQLFLTSIHHSLIWVGVIMLLVSLVASYFTARSIVKPLCQLTSMTNTIKEGKFGQTVVVDRHDEVGVLAQTFNEMSIRLQKNETMRQHLFASIAHELRTPLAIIQGNLEGMIDNVISTDKAMLLSLEEEVMRVNRLVQDLRDVSLAEVGELVLHKRLVDINAMLERAVSMLQPLAEEKNISITMELQPDLPDICVDPDRINQVIYNLLSNAIRYIGEQDTIRVTTSVSRHEGKDWLDIAFIDNGPGIAAEDIPLIFNYFYRGEKSRSRRSGGSGIGLALAQQYVLNHGGTLQVHSEPGKGATFVVRMPVV